MKTKSNNLLSKIEKAERSEGGVAPTSSLCLVDSFHQNGEICEQMETIFKKAG